MFKKKTALFFIGAMILVVSLIQIPCFSAATPYIIITPSRVTLTPGQIQNFTARVSDGSNVQITWSVRTANGGQITESGRYTAPTVPGDYTVVAQGPANIKIGAGQANVKVAAVATQNGYILRYSGSAALTRRFNRNGKVIDETNHYDNLILKFNGDESNPSWSNFSGSARTLVNNKDGATSTYAEQTFSNSNFSVVLTMDKTKKLYTMTVSDLTNINAKITSGGAVSYSPITVMGQTAVNMPLPINQSKLFGHKLVNEPSGAQSILAWTLTEKP